MCKYNLPPPPATGIGEKVSGVVMSIDLTDITTVRFIHLSSMNKGSIPLTFPVRHLYHLDWVQVHVLFLCMSEASAHLLGMHGPAKQKQIHF